MSQQSPIGDQESLPCALLREILKCDREAIKETQSVAPWYKPPEELNDIHRRIELCLSTHASLEMESPAARRLIVAAIQLERYLRRYTGSTADWPIQITTDSDEHAKLVAEALTAVRRAAEVFKLP